MVDCKWFGLQPIFFAASLPQFDFEQANKMTDATNDLDASITSYIPRGGHFNSQILFIIHITLNPNVFIIYVEDRKFTKKYKVHEFLYPNKNLQR